jgi:hypothetical protein
VKYMGGLAWVVGGWVVGWLELRWLGLWVVLVVVLWVGGLVVDWLWLVVVLWLCWLIQSLPAMIRTTYIRHYRIITGIVFFVSYDLRFTIDVSNIIFVFIVPRSVRPL